MGGGGVHGTEGTEDHSLGYDGAVVEKVRVFAHAPPLLSHTNGTEKAMKAL